jgi:hypothetical protein
MKGELEMRTWRNLIVLSVCLVASVLTLSFSTEASAQSVAPPRITGDADTLTLDVPSSEAEEMFLGICFQDGICTSYEVVEWVCTPDLDNPRCFHDITLEGLQSVSGIPLWWPIESDFWGRNADGSVSRRYPVYLPLIES